MKRERRNRMKKKSSLITIGRKREKKCECQYKLKQREIGAHVVNRKLEPDDGWNGFRELKDSRQRKGRS